MKRLKFIKTTGAATTFTAVGGIGLLSAFQSKPFTKHLTILHTNDVHSHIDPFLKMIVNSPILAVCQDGIAIFKR